MRAETILIVDDEKLIRWSLRQALARTGFRVIEAATLKEGNAALAEEDVDLVILDQLLPDGTGTELLDRIRTRSDAMPVVMLTAVDRSDVAVKAMKAGAFDYVTKPVNIEELNVVIEKALETTRVKRQLAHLLRDQQKSGGFCGMIGASAAMQQVFSDITKVAGSSRTTVLITGESGTGKELAAQAIHALSPRKDKPLLTVNCSALAESIMESELFGHERGAFTDARTRKKGIFELADGGALLLDEIGDISLKLQVQLLRAIEQKIFQRVGGTSDISVDVRIFASTNQPLERLIEEQKFRPDLYYRLKVAGIHIPPVRERGSDVLLLAEYFVQEFNTRFHKRFKGLSEATRALFLEYPWPGNVREIRNVVERAVLIEEGEYLEPSHVKLPRPRASAAPHGEPASAPSLFEVEKKALTDALARAGNNQSKAARLLKISRDTLRYKIKKYRLLE